MTEDFPAPYLEPRRKPETVRVSTCAIVLTIMTLAYGVACYAMVQRIDRAERMADHYRRLWIQSQPIPAHGMQERLRVIMPGRLAAAVGEVTR